eukprot:412264_1
MHSTDSYIIVIGHNRYGELGLSNKDESNQLQYMTNEMNITGIHPGYRFTIYRDGNDNYFACGCNENGECGIGEDPYLKMVLKPTKLGLNALDIQRVFTSTRGSGVFWLSNSNKLYANGSNYLYKLGAPKENHYYFQPQFVKSIPSNDHVVDIQTAFGYSLVLCHHPIRRDLIINGWLRRNIHHDIIPCDLIILIQMFYGIMSTLYATIKSGDGGNGLGSDSLPIWQQTNPLQARMDTYWKRIETLQNAQIVKIRTGSAHSLFLDISGDVYSCGWNRFGQLGLSHTRIENIPKLIRYFVEKKIEIRDIACGSRHNLAIDAHHRVYAWGNNNAKQCDPKSNTLQFVVPTLISAFTDCVIKRIECGAWHSCVVTEDGKYYLFGSPQHNMCGVSEDDSDGVSLLNHKICTLLEDPQARIDGIRLGWNNTHIMVRSTTENALKETKDQIGCDHDIVMTETMMGYEFDEEDEEGNNNSVTLMGSVTDPNQAIVFNDDNNSDHDMNDCCADQNTGETLLGYTNVDL